MIAVDTSTLSAYLTGKSGRDVEMFDEFLERGRVVLLLPVIAEILSYPEITDGDFKLLLTIPTREADNQFWTRTGEMRRGLITKGFKAKLGDCLIAQACIDHDLPLLTRDRDFAAIASKTALKVFPA